MKGEISQPLKALELWSEEFASSEFSALNSNLSLPISLYLLEPPPFSLKTMVVFKEGGVKGSMRGGRGWFFCPPPTASHACQPCLVPLCRKKKKKIKKVQKVIQGCKILVPVGTRIKNSSAGLKIKVPAGTVLKN